jgi:cell division protein FtsN
MAQDFAKRKKSSSSKAAAPRKAQAERHGGDKPSRASGVRPFLTGVITGVFLSFLVYLGTLPKPVEPGQEVASVEQPKAEIPKPRFEFYEILPQQNIEVAEPAEVVEPAAELPKPAAATATPQPYFLQAGSFRQQDDAERRRAHLLLMDLDAKIEETSGDNGRWFRVSLGPFDSPEAIAKTRGRLASENIETVLLRRSGP